MSTVCMSLMRSCYCPGAETYFGVMTGWCPATDYGTGTAAGEIITTGDDR